MKEDQEVINAELYLIVPISMASIVSIGITMPFMRAAYAFIGGAVLIILLSNYLFKMLKKHRK